MRQSFFALAATAVLAVGVAASFASAPALDEPTHYTFREPPVNSMGVKSLTELRGKPVLIDFWGTR